MPEDKDSALPTNIWSKVSALAARHRGQDPHRYFDDEHRFEQTSLELDGLFLDWSMQRLDSSTFQALCDLADECGVRERLRNQFAGAVVNTTEDRAALHTALRGTPTADPSLNQTFRDATDEICDFAEGVLTGDIKGSSGDDFTDVIHLGIGGSHLCQAFLSEVLQDTHLHVHFLSGLNANKRSQLLQKMNPSTTLVIVASKSFTTPETQKHFSAVKEWLSRHATEPQAWHNNLVIVTSNTEAASELQCKKFLVPLEIGGRYSVWSAMGLPVVLSAGTTRFRELLSGARAMDEHVAQARTANNAAMILALLSLWNSNGLGATSHVVMPYHPVLHRLVGHLQQLEMESLGKSHFNENPQSFAHTQPVVWGGPETDGQHAWHQMLHQGTHQYSADFIGLTDISDNDNRWMLSNCLSQQHLMFMGHEDRTHPYKSVQGGHGSTLILLNALDAYRLGKLIALYEHKTACLGYLWGVNAFDQWGVERGKQMATQTEYVLNSTLAGTGDPLFDKRLHKIAAHLKN